MTTVGALCTSCRVTVRGLFGESLVPAWRLGDWAAHRQIDVPSLFCLTLLPIGLSLPFAWASFSSLGQAVGAMREIVRLRNDWHLVEQRDFTRALGEQLKQICARYSAVEGAIQWACAADVGVAGRSLDRRYNGYKQQQGAPA